MKRIYRNKKKAKNEFTSLTGILAIQLNGGSECLVTEQKTVSKPLFDRDVSISKAAYHLYNQTPIEDIKSIKHTCGVKNCVQKDHLEAILVRSARKEYNAAQEGWAV